jgi:hypothetical protein
MDSSFCLQTSATVVGKQEHARDAVHVKTWLGRLPNLLCKKFIYTFTHFRKGNRKSATQECSIHRGGVLEHQGRYRLRPPGTTLSDFHRARYTTYRDSTDETVTTS